MGKEQGLYLILPNSHDEKQVEREGGKMKKIRVLLVDDHSLFRSGVKALLQTDGSIDVVGEGGNALKGIELARSLNPDVVLMDISMPGLKGTKAIPALLDAAPSVNLLMLTVSENENDLFEAIKAGAKGYVLKNIEPEDLIRSIKRAAAGEAVMSGSLTGKIMEEFRNLVIQKEEHKEILTPREKEVLLLVAEGMTNKDVAVELSLS
ncbi:MAG: DNA-binding response regulator, partial [Deltaproteobacteria bacterium]|nr:DNA-binding response regulator [Deltaproteobacteria bacterium]